MDSLNLITNEIIDVAVHFFVSIFISTLIYYKHAYIWRSNSVIDPQNKIVTLINTFTLKPEKQNSLIENLNKATEEVFKRIPGFISSNIHRGLEPNRVANYAQWQSKEHYMAALRNPVALAHMKEAAALAETFEPILYEVVSSHGVEGE